MAIIEFGTDEREIVLETGAEAAVDDLAVDDLAVDESLSRPLAVPAEAAATVARRRMTSGLNERLSGGWAAGLTVAWVAIFITGTALEPTPSDPNAAPAVPEAILVVGLLFGWIAMAVGVARRRRFGAAASLVAAVSLVGLTIGCVVSGHHSGIGAWWWFQLAGSTTLAGLSGRALRAV